MWPSSPTGEPGSGLDLLEVRSSQGGRSWVSGSEWLYLEAARTVWKVDPSFMSHLFGCFVLFCFSLQGKRSLSCRPPMVKLVCPADNPRAEGLECAKTCQNYDLQCMSTGCVSGCLCPPGMVSHHGPRGGKPGISLQTGTHEVALGQRRKKQEPNENGNGRRSGDGGRGGGESSVADSATKVGKRDGGKASGVHPDESDKNTGT